MNRKEIHPILRLHVYWNLMSNSEDTLAIDDSMSFGITIDSIAKITNWPRETIRSDFICLFKEFESLPFWIDTSYNEQDYTDEELEDDDMDRDKLIYHLEKGDLDFKPIELYSHDSYNYNKSNYRIPVTKEQFSAISFLMNSKDKDIIHIKKSIFYQLYQNDMNEKITVIHHAFIDNTKVAFNYRTPHNIYFDACVTPAKLIYNSEDNSYSLACTYKGCVKIYKLDRMYNVRNTSKEGDLVDYSLFDHHQQVWGNQFQDKPYKVKVVFYNEVNVWNKVRSDLSCRVKGQLYEKNNLLYYEDIVYGLSSFKRWVLGFGSSAVVLEPVELKNQIIESLQNKLSKYITSPK